MADAAAVGAGARQHVTPVAERERMQTVAASLPGVIPHLLAGVHSRYDQLKQFIDGSVEQGAKRIRVHILTDGRDVPVSPAAQQRMEMLAAVRHDGGALPASQAQLLVTTVKAVRLPFTCAATIHSRRLQVTGPMSGYCPTQRRQQQEHAAGHPRKPH